MQLFSSTQWPSWPSITRSQAWTPFSSCPILDYTYLDLSKYRFLNNFKLANGIGGYKVDANNPARSTMLVSDVQNGVAVDTYDQPTGNRQLTLYEALHRFMLMFSNGPVDPISCRAVAMTGATATSIPFSLAGRGTYRERHQSAKSWGCGGKAPAPQPASAPKAGVL